MTFDAPSTVGSGTLADPSLAFGNGVFVATDGQSAVMTSTDATSWQTVATEPGRDVVFGAGHFAYVGSDAQLRISENGIDWTPVDINGDTTYSLTTVNVIGDALVARSMFQCCFGEDPSSNGYGQAISRDGIVWNFVDYGHSNGTTQLFAMANACFSMLATTFDVASGPNTPCQVAPDLPVLEELGSWQAVVTRGDTTSSSAATTASSRATTTARRGCTRSDRERRASLAG